MSDDSYEPLADPVIPIAYNDFDKPNGLDQADTAVYFREKSMCRQEFAEECDINNIMRGYDIQDIGALMRQGLDPVYVDWTAMPSTLMEFMHLQQSAEEAFMTLPAVVRKEFDNDPIAFCDYASDSANIEKMREWGLAPKPPVESLRSDPAAAAGASPAAPGAPPAGSSSSSSTSS